MILEHDDRKLDTAARGEEMKKAVTHGVVQSSQERAPALVSSSLIHEVMEPPFSSVVSSLCE